MKTKFIIPRSRGHFLLPALIVCIFAGCGDSDPDRARLVGDWGLVQVDSVMRRLEETGSASESNAPGMSLHFRRNGDLQTETRIGNVNQTKQGQWEMISYDATTNAMSIFCQLKMQESEHRVQFITEDTIELTPPNMAGLATKLKFQRQ